MSYLQDKYDILKAKKLLNKHKVLLPQQEVKIKEKENELDKIRRDTLREKRLSRPDGDSGHRGSAI